QERPGVGVEVGRQRGGDRRGDVRIAVAVEAHDGDGDVDVRHGRVGDVHGQVRERLVFEGGEDLGLAWGAERSAVRAGHGDADVAGVVAGDTRARVAVVEV